MAGCEATPHGYDCTDEDGISRHPLADAADETAALVGFTLTAALPFLSQQVEAADRMTVDSLARILIAEWERVEGPVTASYVANFADMARAVLSQQVDPREQIAQAIETDAEGVDPDELLDPAWRMGYRQASKNAAFIVRKQSRGDTPSVLEEVKRERDTALSRIETLTEIINRLQAERDSGRWSVGHDAPSADLPERIARAIEEEKIGGRWNAYERAALNLAARVARETPLTGGGEAVDLESMPIRQRDELVAATLRFMRDRGYAVTMPALSPAPEGEKR